MSIPLNERLIVALDVPSVDEARTLVRVLGDSVNYYKIGLQLQYAGGLVFAEELIGNGKKVFLDSKFLDIGQTVSSAVANVVRMGVSLLTVHAYRHAIRAAVEARGDSDLAIMAVTVLTSMDEGDLRDLGYPEGVEPVDLVLRRARMAYDENCDGVICSGREVGLVRQATGGKLKLITPGIRPAGADVQDQKRVTTPAMAIKDGADHLVVGRPILKADDPKSTAIAINDEIRNALSGQ